MNTPPTLPSSTADHEIDHVVDLHRGYHETMLSLSIGDSVQSRDGAARGRLIGTMSLKAIDLHLGCLSLENGRVATSALGELIRTPNTVRWTLHQCLLECAKAAKANPEALGAAAMPLGAHFRGMHGMQYVNEEAYLWFLCAYVKCTAFVRHNEGAAFDLNERIRLSGVAPELRPPLFDLDAFAQVTRDEQLALSLQDFDKMLAVGHESIDAAVEDETHACPADVVGRFASHRISGERFVVLGPAELRPGLLAVIDLDTGEASAQAPQPLDLTDEYIEADWLWELIVDELRGRATVEVVAWLAYTQWGLQRGQDGLVVDAGERRLEIAAYAALMLTKIYASFGREQMAKRVFKRLQELRKLMDGPARGRLLAMAPELANRSGFDARQMAARGALGVIDQLTNMVDDYHFDTLRGDDASAETEQPSAIDTVLASREPLVEAAETPLIEPPPDLATEAPASAPEAPAAPEAVAAPAPVIAVPLVGDRVLAERPAPARKVNYEPTAKPLRFNFTEHLLLACEWELERCDGAHALAVTSALDWLSKRLGTSLPTSWRDGAHEIERAGVTLQIESAPTLFAFRLDHPDADHPTRWWRVEATVLAGRGDQPGMVGLRTRVRDLVELPPPRVTVPGLVRAWCASPGLMVAGAKAGSTVHVSQPEHLEGFGAIVRRRERQAPLWVLPIDGPRLPQPANGLGRQVRVHPEAMDAYVAAYGPFEPDTLHLYPPGHLRPQVLGTAAADWFQALCERSVAVRLKAESPTFRDVRDAIREARASSPDAPAASPTVDPSTDSPESTQLASEPGPTSAQDTALVLRGADQRMFEELLELAEGERDEYQGQLTVANNLLEQAQDDRNALRAQVAQLQRALEQRGAAAAPAPAAVRETLEGLGDWRHTLNPRVVISDKAARAAAKVEHNEVPKIYAALQALHDLYWPMKFGAGAEAANAKAAWRTFLQANRLTFSGVGSATSNSRYADEYKATVDGKTFMATMHVAGSSAHDPLRCLRVYVACDEAAKRVVVTHLPTHLTSSHT